MDQITIAFILLVLFLLYRVVKAYDLQDLHEGNDYGAVITGINLEKIDELTFNEIHQQLLKYKILVVRNQQNLTAEDLRNFGLKFGQLHVHLESASHLPGFSDVNVVSNIRNNGTHIGLYGAHVEAFHSDLSWSQHPAKFTMLKSVIRPEQCGDTEFLDTHSAYNDLKTELKTRLSGKTAAYCYLKLKGVDTTGKTDNLQEKEAEIAKQCATHPLFTTHPITGRKNIYANPTDTALVHNMTRSESDKLLKELFDHTANGKYLYRHKYQDNDLIIWDNRGEKK
jgi:taurine dioxygenase